jgi:hypothetical protein
MPTAGTNGTTGEDLDQWKSDSITTIAYRHVAEGADGSLYFSILDLVKWDAA